MKSLIFNADDFGITKGVSEGIIEACEYGVVRSTTMLANTEYFDHAISLLKNNVKIGVGVHLTLTLGRPVLESSNSLVSKRGVFLKEAELELKLGEIDYNDILAEFRAQIEKIKRAGIEITHFDTHSHIHRMPKINKAIAELAREYGVPVRRTVSHGGKIKTTDVFSDSFHNENATDIVLKMLVRKHDHAKSLEIMCHPGYFDPELLYKSSYTKKREAELAVLTSYELLLHFERAGIRLINFGEL